MKIKTILLLIFLFVSFNAFSQDLNDYYYVIKSQGEEPAAFISNKLNTHDLIIFDDALHLSVEPFEFICAYLTKNPVSVDYVFLEVFHITAQKSIDEFLNCSKKDTAVLADVFQGSYSYGMPYETYLTLFCTVWDINQQLPEKDKIRIIAIDQPIYWEGLHTREDYNIFLQSLSVRDYFMYMQIIKQMDNFNSGRKGLFLTNTRHAYKCIKNKDGQIYWNVGTFFNQWHSGKTYSVRFHNMILNISSENKDAKNRSAEGLDALVYNWVHMDNGLWDEAFAKNGNKPVAVPFKNNIFGQHQYLGNHMADALPGQTMYHANDALIFLKPLVNTKFSAHTDFFYTDTFKKELEHRIQVIEGHNLDNFLKENDVSNIKEYIEKLSKYVSETPNSLVE